MKIIGRAMSRNWNDLVGMSSIYCDEGGLYMSWMDLDSPLVEVRVSAFGSKMSDHDFFVLERRARMLVEVIEFADAEEHQAYLKGELQVENNYKQLTIKPRNDENY